MDEMELDERKIKILDAIIRNYLETGEPVGSRTISKYTDLNLSSATIRNEMADLEELGYILQPHTSAGRIPSDKGYRFYVIFIITVSSPRSSRVDRIRPGRSHGTCCKISTCGVDMAPIVTRAFPVCVNTVIFEWFAAV